MLDRFERMNVQVLGISVDHIPCLKAWSESLGNISFPLISDFYPHGEIAQRFGVFRSDGKSERAIFIIDPEGIIQYIDIHDIDDQPDNEVLFNELNRIVPDKFNIPLQVMTEPAPKPDTDVVLYCTDWCPSCRLARAWLERNKIEYTEINIDRDLDAAKRVQGWADGNRTTPTFDIRDNIIVGFEIKKLEELLLK